MRAVEVGNDVFLITAAHVLADGKTAGLHIASPVSGAVPLDGESRISSDETDIGVARLGDLQKSSISDAELLHLSDVDLTFSYAHQCSKKAFGAYAVLGYPEILTQHDETGIDAERWECVTYPYYGATSYLKGFSGHVHAPFDASIEETWDENDGLVRTSYRRVVRSPRDIKAASGCSILLLAYLREDGWRSVVPQVVGVQACVYSESKVLRGTLWGAAALMLYECFPDTRPTFEPVFGP